MVSVTTRYGCTEELREQEMQESQLEPTETQERNEIMSYTPTNYPRDVIMQKANDAIAQTGGRVYFKFTCSRCGERVQFQEANKLYERGECCNCGLDQPITEAGFALEIHPGSKE